MGPKGISMLTTASNATANTAIRYLKTNASEASESLAKLSSGSRIVKASDDAASLAVGTKIKADVTTLKVAQSNASQATSLLQVADGGMARIGDMLQRMKALSTQSTSGAVSNNERAFIDQEFQALKTQIDEIADNTKFNGQALLNGSAGKSLGEVTDLDQNGTADDAGTGIADLAAKGVTLSLSGDAAAGDWSLSYVAGTGLDDGNAGTTENGVATGRGVFTLTNKGATSGAGDNTIYKVEVDATKGLVIDGTVDFAAAGVSVNLKNFDDATDVAAASFTVVGSGTLSFQVGVTSSETIAVNISDVNVAALGINGTDTKTLAGAQAAGNALDGAISNLNTARANNGSMMSRFEFASANLATQVENLDAARSTLMDVDVADEMTKFSASNVLQQAATSMLAQANQMPQGLLRLLG